MKRLLCLMRRFFVHLGPIAEWLAMSVMSHAARKTLTIVETLELVSTGVRDHQYAANLCPLIDVSASCKELSVALY